MANRLIEGWDWLPAASNVETLLNKAQWYDAGLVQGVFTSSDTAFGYGNSLSYSGDYSNQTHTVYPVGRQSEGYVGARIKVGASHSAWGALTFVDLVTGVTQFSVGWTHFGLIQAFRGKPSFGSPTIGGDPLLISSAPATFFNESWFILEVYNKTGNGMAGAYEVRINTVPVFTVPNDDTQASARGYFDAVGVLAAATTGFSGFTQFKIDDLWFNDPTGAINNSFLGNARVKALLTAADGASTDFVIGGTAPAASRWQSLRNNLLTTAQFLYSATAGDKELSTVTPIVNAPLVHALQLSGAWWQDDATQRAARNLLRASGGGMFNGADAYLNQSPSIYRDTVELNPDTGVQFTGAEVNAIQIGGEVRI